MNNGKLLLATAVIVGSTLIGTSVIKNNFSSRYQPLPQESYKTEQTREAEGAARWWFNMLKDENGQINPARMEEVRAQVAMMGRQKSMNAWPLTFSEIGPDNVGGRTRAFCIDKNNHSHIFAGGVSGGLFESTDGGSTWTHKLASDQYDVLTITSIAQAADGQTWYFGTGEGIYYQLTGWGTSGFIGGGVWKSTDNGATFTRLSSTTATTPSAPGAWSSVGKIACDPVNANVVYVGTNNGFKVSADGGATWANGGTAMVGTIYDVDVASNGAVYVVVGGRIYSSPTGAVGSYTLMPGSTGIPTSGIGRTELAIAPSDPNYIYAVMATPAGALYGAYMTMNGGQTWNQISAGNNQVFAPFGTTSLQGGYDMALAVDPFDKGRVILGGVALWQWKIVQSTNPVFGQWTQIAFEFGGPGNPYYVHSDKHIIVFNPSVQGSFYIGCDGGIFHTSDGGMTYIPMNKNYRVTQCYGIAFDYFAPSRSVALAGCQDNGTQFVTGLGNTPMSSPADIGAGDGGTVEMSFLNPNALFWTVYYGSLSRSSNRGSSSGSFYSSRISASTTLGQAGFANFVTPITLWESLNDANTKDSVRFVATHQLHDLAQGNGSTTAYADTLKPNYNGTVQPNAQIIPGSVVVSAGNVTMTDVLQNNTLTGSAGTGTINYATKILTMNFTNPVPVGTLIRITYDVTYAAGAQLLIISHTNNLSFGATCPITISSLGPNDTVYVKDIIQSKLAVGFSGSNGVYVTRKPLDFSTDPVWIKVAGTNSVPNAFSGGTTVQSIHWAPDGNTLYFGTDGGNVYRVDNAGSVSTDTAASDIEIHSGTTNIPNPRTPVRVYRIGNFGNPITSLDVDPNNPNRLLITVGAYTGGPHIFMCNNAPAAPSDLTSSSNFVSVQGNLPPMPVYACSFDRYNNNHVMIGCDYGIYSTDNITGTVSWTSQSPNGFANVPTLQIRQSRWDPWNGCQNSGVFYIATHGRGMWKSEVSYLPMSVQDHPSVNHVNNAPVINIFPNPMNETGHVSFSLNQSGKVYLRIYSLRGQLVKEMQLSDMQKGDNTVEFDTNDLSSGTYLMSFESGSQKGVSRFIVSK